MADQTRTKAGEPQRIDTDKVECPDCGVVQRVTVLIQRFEDSTASHYVDRECPVCGYDDVWF